MKAKIPIACAAIMLFLTAPAQAALNLDIYEDAVIQEGDSYNVVSIYDTPPGHTTVSMTGGLVDQMDTYDESRLNVAAGEIFSMYMRDSSTANIFGGHVGEVIVWDSATADLSKSGSVSSLSARGETATVNMIGGVTTYLRTGDSGTVNIYGGEIRDSIETWNGGTINIYGYGFSYDPSAGNWNGGQLSGLWLDGTAFQIDLYDAQTYDSINFVPEPSSLLLFLIGGWAVKRGQT